MGWGVRKNETGKKMWEKEMKRGKVVESTPTRHGIRDTYYQQFTKIHSITPS